MVIVIILVLSFIVHSSTINEECQTREQTGTCQRFTNCSYAVRLVRENDRPDICEFEGLEPIVCCPNQFDSISIALVGKDNPNTSNGPSEDLSESIETLSHKMCLKYYPKPDFVIMVAGGKKSLPQEFPHMAAIGFGENEMQWLCGGSLISKKYVLTAGHCTFSHEFGQPKWVRLGDLDLSTDTDNAEPQDYTIKRIITYPDYKPALKYHDIALVELDRIVSFTQYVSPACLPDNRKMTDISVNATGWGKTSFLGDTSTYLLKVDLKLIDKEKCSKSYSNFNSLPKGIDDQTQICAGGDLGKDTCPGDSGGPLQVKNHEFSYSDLIQVHTIIGVTSFGKACALSRTPGVYTRVSYYRSWIERIVWEDEDL